MRAAILQMTSGIDPDANVDAISNAAAEARAGGADLLTTPEMATLLDRDRKRATKNIVREEDSRPLDQCREIAAREKIWLHIGSMAMMAGPGDKWVNRAYLIKPDGDIAARYDKIHLFDAVLGGEDRWCESAAFSAGDRPVVVQTPMGRIALTICYDLRFPALFDRIGSADPQIILCPAAFTYPTGCAHWHVLMRARAIETASFMLAAAQTGRHEDGRRTYGHSLAAGPWGDVLHDMGTEPGVAFVSLDLEEPERIRQKVPGLVNRREIAPVELIET